jgi:hypothetical protein
MDLFTEHDPEQEAMRDAMQKQWRKDCKEIKAKRIIPDWKGEPKPLSKDKAALLQYLYDHGFIAWPSAPGPERVRAAKMLGYTEKADGTIAVANAKAVIDSCLRDGLIEARLYRGQQVLQMTQDGEYALEEWQIEREMGFL